MEADASAAGLRRQCRRRRRHGERLFDQGSVCRRAACSPTPRSSGSATWWLAAADADPEPIRRRRGLSPAAGSSTAASWWVPQCGWSVGGASWGVSSRCCRRRRRGGVVGGWSSWGRFDGRRPPLGVSGEVSIVGGCALPGTRLSESPAVSNGADRSNDGPHDGMPVAGGVAVVRWSA